LGVKPASAIARRATTFVAKPRTDLPPAPNPVEPAPAADFATLVPTLSSLDRILQPLASDVPGLATPLSRRRIAAIGRFGAAFGLATLAAAVVFFR
jgi:hypothetical protein